MVAATGFRQIPPGREGCAARIGFRKTGMLIKKTQPITSKRNAAFSGIQQTEESL
jgi:hypothetical protein